jgi:hypothetical protein
MGLGRIRRIVPTAAVAALLSAALSGCVGGPGMPVPTYTPSGSSTATASPSGKPALVPEGTAAENQAYFDSVNAAFYLRHGKSDGRSIIDNLIGAGFSKQDMEVTPDNTQVTAADSIIFSVRVKGECLIGQFSSGGYDGTIGPILGTGGCLVGTTRPIDW